MSDKKVIRVNYNTFCTMPLSLSWLGDESKEDSVYINGQYFDSYPIKEINILFHYYGKDWQQEKFNEYYVSLSKLAYWDQEVKGLVRKFYIREYDKFNDSYWWACREAREHSPEIFEKRNNAYLEYSRAKIVVFKGLRKKIKSDMASYEETILPNVNQIIKIAEFNVYGDNKYKKIKNYFTVALAIGAITYAFTMCNNNQNTDLSEDYTIEQSNTDSNVKTLTK